MHWAAQSQTASLAQLTDYMTGRFNSSEQAARDSAFLDVSLHMERIWERKHEGVWIYVEQALTATPDEPYRQQVYKLEELGSNKYLSRVFELANPDEYIGAAQKPKRFNKLLPNALEEMNGCALNLIYDERKQKFIGNMAEICYNDWNGAYVASSEVEITNGQVIRWHRGWDREGRQVWGAEKGGYVFLKQ